MTKISNDRTLTEQDLKEWTILKCNMDLKTRRLLINTKKTLDSINESKDELKQIYFELKHSAELSRADKDRYALMARILESSLNHDMKMLNKFLPDLKSFDPSAPISKDSIDGVTSDDFDEMTDEALMQMTKDLEG